MEKLKIEAIVKFNSRHAYVLNRDLHFEYVQNTIQGRKLLWAQDEGFYNVHIYESSTQAFAGRKFNLHLKKGGVVECHGQWWDGGQKLLADSMGIKIIPATVRTIEELKECYVFTGCEVEAGYIEELAAAYTGTIYEYRDYEKVINYDDMRKRHFREGFKLRHDKKAIVKQVKAKHKELEKMKAQMGKIMEIIKNGIEV